MSMVEYTDGKRLMLKCEWIEDIMMQCCCTKAKASKIFRDLLDSKKIWAVEEW